MVDFQGVKFAALAFTGLPKDALHVYVGLFVLFAASWALRQRVGKMFPLGIVLGIALAGEAWDIVDRWAIGRSADPSAHWHDIWNTLFWPTAITLLARYTNVFRASGDRR